MDIFSEPYYNRYDTIQFAIQQGKYTLFSLKRKALGAEKLIFALFAVQRFVKLLHTLRWQ